MTIYADADEFWQCRELENHFLKLYKLFLIIFIFIINNLNPEQGGDQFQHPEESPLYKTTPRILQNPPLPLDNT